MGSNGDEFYPPVDNVQVPDLPIESNSPTSLQNLEHDVPYKSITQATPVRAGPMKASEIIAQEAIRDGDNFKQKQ